MLCTELPSAGSSARRSWRPIPANVSLFGLALGYLLPAATLSAPSVESADTNDSLSEIIVTARKVEEDVQDVPMSVQTLSADFLDEANLSRLFDLQFNVPGLVVNNHGGFGAGFSLRGVADQGGGDLSVTPHLNDVYLGTSGLAITRLFDLQRIEVLKGPQGTLYGRNSTGGSINFVTRQPQREFGADVELAFASFATTRLQGNVNLPFDKTALRLSAIASNGDGYIRNSVDQRRFGEDDFWGIRGALLFEPDDRLRVNVMAQRIIDDGASGELWLPNPEFLADPDDIHLTTVTLADPYLKVEADYAIVDIEVDFGRAALRAITGFARSESHNKDDCAGMPFLLGCVREIDPLLHRQWSQELQLASSGNDVVDWLVGANYYVAESSTRYYLLTPVVGPDPQNDSVRESDHTALAVFGQSTMHLTDRWSATLGLRFSRNESRVSAVGYGARDNPSPTTTENAWNNVSWRLDAAYAVDDDILLYASAATGFKSGGLTADILSDGEFESFDPEYLLAYEVGIKSRWLNHRLTLNSSMFVYLYDDMQVNTLVFVDGEFLNVTDNAAKARIDGLDATATLAMSDRLTLSAGLVWLPQREFIDYRNDLTGDTLSGNKLSRAPEWTVSTALEYAHPLREHGTFSLRIEHNSRSAFFYTKENSPIYAQDGFGLLNVFLRYEPDSTRWYAFATGRNLTDADYFTQVFLQSSPGYPATYEAGFGLRF